MVKSSSRSLDTGGFFCYNEKKKIPEQLRLEDMMKLFQTLFGKRKKKKKEEEPQCWYNNFHEQKSDRWVPPTIEGGALCSSPNQGDFTAAQQISDQQG